MVKNTVHEPELPGVHTYKDDIEGSSKESSGGVSFTVPDAVPEIRAEEKGANPTARAQSKGLFDVGRAFNDEDVQEGTIVTDKRSGRRSLGSIMKGAFTEWWDKTQESVIEATDKLEFLQPKEVPTVADPEIRKGTLLEAAEHAKRAPQDDHKVVIEKIRTFAQDAEAATGKPFSIKPSTEGDVPSWIKEAQKKKEEREAAEKAPEEPPKPLPTLDLRTSAVAPDVTAHSRISLAAYGQKEPQKKVVPEPVTRTPAGPVASPIKAPEKKPSSWTFFKEAEHAKVDARAELERRATLNVPRPTPKPHLNSYSEIAKKPDTQKPTPQETFARPTPPPPPPPLAPNVSLSPVHFEDEAPVKKKDAPLVAEAHLENVYAKRAPHVEKRGKQIAIVAGVVILGSALGMFAAFSFKSPFPDTPTPPPAPVIPSFLTTDAQSPLPLPATREQFLSALTKHLDEPTTGVSQYYPVIGANAAVASTDDVMKVLEPRAPGSFIRALNPNLMFGILSAGETRQPYIILQSQNFDVVFAGMLEWEPFMSADLAPFFGTPVTKTLSPTTKAVTSARFTDALRSNRSIRILYNENGEERIVYALVNKNLILITTTTEALSKLIERIR